MNKLSAKLSKVKLNLEEVFDSGAFLLMKHEEVNPYDLMCGFVIIIDHDGFQLVITEDNNNFSIVSNVDDDGSTLSRNSSLRSIVKWIERYYNSLQDVN